VVITGGKKNRFVLVNEPSVVVMLIGPLEEL